ncbi:MAG TPA: ABC transporter permease [Candidatus Angelobacter sp.]
MNLLAPFRRTEQEWNLDDELRFHMEKQVEANVAAGMSPQEAWRQAGIALGGIEQTRENVREVRWNRIPEILVQDTRYALRMLRKSPAFTTVAILTLALSIGLNTAIFSLISALLYRSLPVRNPQELVVLHWSARQEPDIHMGRTFGDCDESRDGLSGCTFSLPFFQAVQRESGIFLSVAAWAGNDRMTLSGNGPATMINGGNYVSGAYFQTLGVDAALGRTLLPGDDSPGAPPVTVLSYSYWQTAFAGSRSVVGQTIKLNATPVTIVGVAEKKFQQLTLANRPDLYLPLSVRRQLTPGWKPDHEDATSTWLTVMGRINPEKVGQAQAAMNLLYRNETMHGERPFFKAEAEPRLELRAAQQELTGDSAEKLKPMYVMLLCVGLVLLIACANVAGLQLARSAARQKEIAVRLMLGARRSRLAWQLLVESILLSLMGGALGLVLAIWAARGLLVLIARGVQEELPISPQVDWRVLGFTAAVSILTGLLFGLAPALRGLRPDLASALKAAGGEAGATALRSRFGLRNFLVAGQMALAIVVLVTAGLLVRTLLNLKGLNPGFDTRNVLLFGIDPTMAGYKDAKVGHLYAELQAEFSALPGVTAVSYSWIPPLGQGLWITTFHLPGNPPRAESRADFYPVGPGFFSTMRIELRTGRDFRAPDFNLAAVNSGEKASLAPTPVIVNQRFVERYFPKVNPIGQHFEETEPEHPTGPKRPGYDIVGVVADAKYNQLRREIQPTVYAPISGQQAHFEVRTKGDPKAIIPAVRKIVDRVDDNLALFRFSTETQQIELITFEQRLVAQLSSFFGSLGLLLACLGLYGLLSYEVTQRTREIGIRMAVGARRPDVVRLVLRQAIVLVLAGAVVGVAASLGVARVMSSFLYGVRSADPLTLISVAIVLVTVGFAACYLPARRATRVDPLVALRYE